MGREHLAIQLERRRSSVEKALALYTRLATIVESLNAPRVIPDDPDDDHVLAAGVAARADLIVSGDRHLLNLGVYLAIRIVQPSDAVAIIGGA